MPALGIVTSQTEPGGGRAGQGACEQDMSPEGQALPKPPETICIAGPGEKILRDFQVLVQKVGGRPEVLLIGETLEGQDIHGMMASFVNDVFSSSCQPVHPGDLLKEPPSTSVCTLGGKQCQLIFFLCRASCMAGKQAELQRVLKEVQKFVQKSPCALVGIIMDAKPAEAETARAQLLRLLRGVFAGKGRPPKEKPEAGGTGQRGTAGATELEDVEVEAEIYIPGQPRGRLAVMRAACRASEALQKPRGLLEVERKEPVTESKDPLPVTGSCLCTVIKAFLILATLFSLVLAVWYATEEGVDLPKFVTQHLASFF